MKIENKDQARKFLINSGAPEHLINHSELVCEVSELLTNKLSELGVSFDKCLIQIGAMLHDYGKIEHPEELYKPGNKHEEAGFRLLLANNIECKIAAFCISHASWSTNEISFEELIVALADKLWKGKREEDLELLIIDRVANIIQSERWAIFTEIDLIFEKIAADGDKRLKRSIIET